MSVPRWNKGSEVVERLLESGHLQRVPADEATVEALLAQLAATSRRRQPLPQAIQRAHMPLAYDAARKTATALLAHQGLRPTTTGGHIVLVESVTAQFPECSRPEVDRPHAPTSQSIRVPRAVHVRPSHNRRSRRCRRGCERVCQHSNPPHRSATTRRFLRTRNPDFGIASRGARVKGGRASRQRPATWPGC